MKNKYLFGLVFVFMFGFNIQVSIAHHAGEGNVVQHEVSATEHRAGFWDFVKNLFSFSKGDLSATASKGLSDIKVEPVEQKESEEELKIATETKVLESQLDTANNSVNTQNTILNSSFLSVVVPEKIANTTKLDKKVENRNTFLIKLAEKNTKEAIAYIEKNKLVDLQQGTTTPIRKITKKNITVTIGHAETEGVDRADYFASYLDGRTVKTILSDSFIGLGGEYEISELTGYTVGDRIIITNITGLEKIRDPLVLQKVPPIRKSIYKVLVVLVDYLDSDSPQITDAQNAHNVLFNGDLHDFFYEQSYGKMNMTGDVYGWYRLNSNSEGTYCNPMLTANNDNFGVFDNQELMNYMVVDNIPVSSYDHVMIIANCKNVTGGGFAGAFHYRDENSYLSGWQDIGFTTLDQYVPIAVVKTSNGGANLHTMAHELGHYLDNGSYGHANAYDCGDQVISLSGCTDIEYGNYFDAMGSWQAFANHFRIGMKYALGWLDPSQILTIEESSPEEGPLYALSPTETIGGHNGGYKMALIKPFYLNNPPYNIDYAPYILEYRRGVGYDSNLGSYVGQSELFPNTDGLFIYKNYGPGMDGTQLKQALLLDMNPHNVLWDEDVKHVTLNVGQSFTDEALGIKIETIDANPQNVFLKTTYASCVLSQPSIIYSLDPIVPPIFGASSSYQIILNVRNEDTLPCGNSTFNISISTINPLYLIAQNGNGSWNISIPNQEIGPSQTNHITSFKVLSSASSGEYPVTLTVTNQDSGQTTTQIIQLQ